MTREQFAREVIGASVPLRDEDEVVGVLGVVLVREEPSKAAAPASPPPDLTPRGHEVLRLLAEGRTTVEICEELGIALETTRNHIRGVLRALGVKTRLEGSRPRAPQRLALVFVRPGG